MKLNVAYVAEWTEFEHDGWASQRPDGFSIFKTKEELLNFINKRESSGCHSLFFRADEPYPINVIDEDVYKKVLDLSNSGKAVWVEKNPSSVFKKLTSYDLIEHILELQKPSSN